MTTQNDVTGDSIKTKSNSKKYRDNWDMIFNKGNHNENTETEKANINQKKEQN